MVLTHPIQRLVDRIPIAQYRAVEEKLRGLEVEPPTEDTAFICGEVPRVYAHSEHDSNGDTIVAIFRGGRCVTVMLRRSTQPATPKALRVFKVSHI